MTSGFHMNSGNWSEIQGYNIKRSYITIFTIDDKEIRFRIRRLIDKEDFLALLDSKTKQ